MKRLFSVCNHFEINSCAIQQVSGLMMTMLFQSIPRSGLKAQKGSYMLIDLYPQADCIVDLPYMERYLDPLEDAYDKGLKNFSERGTRDPNWWRAFSSPYALTADFGPSTKQTQENIISLTSDYLEVYYDLWKKDEPS